jgi:hypothetical protein
MTLSSRLGVFPGRACFPADGGGFPRLALPGAPYASPATLSPFHGPEGSRWHPPETTSVAHRCRKNNIDGPSMQFGWAFR